MTSAQRAKADTAVSAAINGVEAGSRQWSGWIQDASRVNLGGWHALMACRTPEAAFAVQARLAREQLDLLMNSSRQMSAPFLALFKVAEAGAHQGKRAKVD